MQRLDENIRYENTALNFAQFLIQHHFNVAFALLIPSLKSKLNLAELEKTYLNMERNFNTPATHVEVIEALSDWPEN